MDDTPSIRSLKTKRFRWWFSRKKKKADPFNHLGEVSGSILYP